MKQDFEINDIKSKHSIVSIWDSILEDINNDVLFSGKPIDTLVYLKKMRKTLIIVASIFIPTSIFLAIFFSSPIYLFLNVTSVLVFAYPKIYYHNIHNERKKKVEEELPSFVIFASVLQNVGIGLYDSFQLFKDLEIFTAIKKEAMLLNRNTEQFGVSQIEALEELGRTHKSDLFKNLLLGYTSIWRSGGDLSLYLEGRADEFFINIRTKYQTYTNNVGTIVEVLVTLLIILPIMIMVSSFVLPGGSLEQVTLLSTVGIPIFAILMGLAVSSIQPSSFNKVGLDPKLTIILVIIGLISGYTTYLLSSEQIWLSIAIGTIVPSAISAIIAGRQTHEINKSENSLPQFLRDMIEYKKIGHDIVFAIIILSKENQYDKSLQKYLVEISMLLDAGNSPITTTKSIAFRSWFSRISFYLLSYIAEFGGGTPKTLETVNHFITTAKQVVKEGKSSISMLTLIIFAAPIIMAFTASMLIGILDSFEPNSFASPSSLNNVEGGTGLNADFITLITITPEFLEMTKILIVTSSVFSAFVITKAIDFTFYSTWRVVIIGVLSILAVLFMDVFQNIDLSIEGILEGFIQ